MLAAFLALLASPPAAPLGSLTARAGQNVTLVLDFPTQGALLNREAPNLLKLVTPWQTIQARPTGTPHLDPVLADYFGKVDPTRLNVRIPTGTTPGRYPAKLSARLYMCDEGQRLCTRRDLVFPLVVNVGVSQGLAVQKLRLRAIDLQPAHRR